VLLLYLTKLQNVKVATAFQLAPPDPGVKREKPGGPSAVGARIEAPKAPREVGCGEGVSPSSLGEGPGKGAVPPPQKFFLDI